MIIDNAYFDVSDGGINSPCAIQFGFFRIVVTISDCTATPDKRFGIIFEVTPDGLPTGILTTLIGFFCGYNNVVWKSQAMSAIELPKGTYTIKKITIVDSLNKLVTSKAIDSSMPGCKSLTIIPPDVSINFSSTPQGASIFIDAETAAIGVTPFNTMLPVGLHTITMKLPGYQDASQIANLIYGSRSLVNMTLVPTGQTGSISVSSTPTGANVFYNSESISIGKTPLQLSNVPAGSHTITLKLTGYQDISQSVAVVASQTSTVSMTLTPVSITGTISISSNPSGARVFYDSESTARGVTPLQLNNVPAGIHTITLKLIGYRDYPQSVNVAANQTATVNVALTQLPQCGGV